jgi:hypothetical protein
MSGGLEAACVADGGEYRRCGPDADSRQGHQGPGKREVIEDLFAFGGDEGGVLVFQSLDLRGDARGDEFDASVPATVTVCRAR